MNTEIRTEDVSLQFTGSKGIRMILEYLMFKYLYDIGIFEYLMLFVRQCLEVSDRKVIQPLYVAFYTSGLH